MGPHDHQEEDIVGELCSEESLSRSDSVDHLSQHTLEDGLVEERFRVDRMKLEAMILGRLPPHHDHDLRLPLNTDGSVMSAEAFFRKIMDETETEIRYPKFLKSGARSKKDPHVRVVGGVEGVQVATSLVREELDPPNRVTMKMDVPWTHHSHIIGKSGNTIQPVVKKTGVSIHFPDGNKSNEVKKSNQVSINSRGEDLSGLEEARHAIRKLTPLVFTFTLAHSVQIFSVVDANMLLLHVQNTYNVQVELRVTDKLALAGCVRGSEAEAHRVKEATHYILQAYCSTLASQVAVQMTVEISPQHHAFVLGRNNERIKRIIHRTATKISFADWSDQSLSPLKKSTVTITGALENVYTARQNIIGSLPLVLMFDLVSGQAVDMGEVGQMMQCLDVQIALKACRMDGRRPIVVKGAERNAENVYKAWQMLCKVDTPAPKANIPPSYHIADTPNTTPNTGSDLGYGGPWVGDGGGGGGEGSSPIPSPTSTPTPHHHHPYTSLWGGISSTSTSSTTTTTLLPPLMSRPLLHDPTPPSNTFGFYSGTTVFRNGIYHNMNNNNNNYLTNNNNGGGSGTIRNDICILPKDPKEICSGSGGVNLDSLMKSMRAMDLTNGELSCGTSSNSGGSSSLSSPAHSPRNTSPDQTLGSSINSSTSQQQLHQDHHHHHHPGMDTLSALLKDVDRRAPGCEKKHMERVAAVKMTLSDYRSKKMEAARAMKQDVGPTPRTPTSSWSGYGFSKSMPGFMIKQKLQEAKEARQNGVVMGLGGGGGVDEWSDTWQHKAADGALNGLTDYSSNSPHTTTTTTTHLNYHNNVPQFPEEVKTHTAAAATALPSRGPVNLSASNFMDCMLPRELNRTPLHLHPLSTSAASTTTLPISSTTTTSSRGLDISTILTSIELPQYIDVFFGQEVDLKMFLSLEDCELKELGISIFGHRKRILMAIKDLLSKSSLFGGGPGGIGNQHTPLRDHTSPSTSTWN